MSVGIQITERVATFSEGCFETTLCLAEATGFGVEQAVSSTGQAPNLDAYWKPVVDYIESKNDAHWKGVIAIDRANQAPADEEECLMTGSDCGLAQARYRQTHDGRVHCCLYFVSPNFKGLRPIDIAAMKGIGNKCNLVPIIAKADTLSATELTALKTIIRETLKAHNVMTFDKVYSALLQHQAANSAAFDEFMDPTDEEHLNETSAIMDDEDGPVAQRTAETFGAFPLAVIGASTDSLNALFALNNQQQQHYVQPNQQTVLLSRTYLWGQVEVENESYSDFKKVRSLLFRVNMDDLIYSTRIIHWEKYRRTKLQSCTSVAVKKANLALATGHQSGAEQENATKMIEEAKAELDAYAGKEEKRLREYEQRIRDLKERLEREIEKEHFEVRAIQEKLIGYQQRRNPAMQTVNCQ